MRALFAAALIALATLPALAQDSVREQLESGFSAFVGGLTSDEMARGRYFDALVLGIDGTWIFGNPLAAGIGDSERFEASFAEACASRAVFVIAAAEPFTLTMSRGNAERGFTITFVYRNGANFSSHLDPARFLAYMDMTDEDKRQNAVNSLSVGTAPVMIFRPAPDLLAIARTLGSTDLYIRCPSGDGPAADNSAFDDELGAWFDRSFKNVKNNAIRSSFVSCLSRALSPLSADDKQTLIDTNFDPGQEFDDRLGTAYPGVKEAAGVCFRATEQATSR